MSQSCWSRWRQWRYQWAVPLLVGYVFFKEFKPSEAYLTPFLVHIKAIPEAVTYEDIYPVWTYASAVLCLVAFLFTDLLGYKTVVLVEAAAYLATRFLLVWGTSVFAMQAAQFCYAIATSTELGYFAYVYSVSPPGRYQHVTSATKAGVLLGKFSAALVGQVAVSSAGRAALLPLNYVSLAMVAVACVICASLRTPGTTKAEGSPQPNTGARQVLLSPVAATDRAARVSRSAPTGVSPDTRANRFVGGHGGSATVTMTEAEPQARVLLLKEGPSDSPPKPDGAATGRNMGMFSSHAWLAFRTFYTDWHNLRWSLWAAAGVCGLYQVENFNQNLWDEVTGGKSEWNGLANIAATVIGVAATAVPSCLKPTACMFRQPEPLLAGFSVICGLCLVTMASTRSVMVVYGAFVLFKAAFTFTATIASAQIALGVARTLDSSRRRFGMVYGFNTLVALGMETLLQLAIGRHGFGLDIRRQFFVYGAYFACLGATFAVAAAAVHVCGSKNRLRAARVVK